MIDWRTWHFWSGDENMDVCWYGLVYIAFALGLILGLVVGAIGWEALR